jgi:hypothetical protein
VDDAVADFVFVSQVEQQGKRNVTGEKAQTVESRDAAEELSSFSFAAYI